MFFEHRSFWLPKDLQDRPGYQDAFEVDAQRGFASIADGVGSSLFSGSWATLLVQSTVRESLDIEDASSFGPWLQRQRDAWIEPIDPDALAWHQKPKLAAGAHSTLLWLHLETDGESEPADPQVKLNCWAIGDCCLFHVRDGKVLRAFPMEQSELYTATPATLASLAGPGDAALRFHTLQDRCQHGDLLVLTTDAFAVWALKQLEDGGSPDWESLWNQTPQKFEEEVQGWRKNNEIRFDDTTVVLLRINAEPAGSTPSPPKQGDALKHLMDDVKTSVDEAKDQVKSTLDEASENLKTTIDEAKDKAKRSVKRLRKWRTGGNS